MELPPAGELRGCPRPSGLLPLLSPSAGSLRGAASLAAAAGLRGSGEVGAVGPGQAAWEAGLVRVHP